MSGVMRDIERLEILAGERAGGIDVKKRAAVRIADLVGLLEMPVELKSAKAVGDPPTQAEYDALREDVENLRKRFEIVAQALTRRLIG